MEMINKDYPNGNRECAQGRLKRLGPGALNDIELFRCLLGNQCPSDVVKKLAESGVAFAVANVDELMNVYGLSEARAISVVSASELGRRLVKRHNQRNIISQPGDVYTLLAPDLRYKNEEYFYMLALNNRGGVLSIREITKGTLTNSLVHPREVFKQAIVANAAKIIVAHNHPGGDPAPSRADRNVTKMLKDAGEIVGIELVDHIIISDGSYYSFSDSGTL